MPPCEALPFTKVCLATQGLKHHSIFNAVSLPLFAYSEGVSSQSQRRVPQEMGKPITGNASTLLMDTAI